MRKCRCGGKIITDENDLTYCEDCGETKEEVQYEALSFHKPVTR